jgi:hypothetical protein
MFPLVLRTDCLPSFGDPFGVDGKDELGIVLFGGTDELVVFDGTGFVVDEVVFDKVAFGVVVDVVFDVGAFESNFAVVVSGEVVVAEVVVGGDSEGWLVS